LKSTLKLSNTNPTWALLIQRMNQRLGVSKTCGGSQKFVRLFSNVPAWIWAMKSKKKLLMVKLSRN